MYDILRQVRGKTNFSPIDFQSGGEVIKTVFVPLKFNVVARHYGRKFPPLKMDSCDEVLKDVIFPIKN